MKERVKVTIEQCGSGECSRSCCVQIGGFDLPLYRDFDEQADMIRAQVLELGHRLIREMQAAEANQAEELRGEA